MAYRSPYSRRRTYPQWYKINRVQPGELLGSLRAEQVRCGKENCRCASGKEEDLHGPYWYRYWREEDGKQHKTYVKRAELEEVRAALRRRAVRLALERAERDRHLRRGMGNGRPAHEWRRLNQPDLLTKITRLREQLRRMLG